MGQTNKKIPMSKKSLSTLVALAVLSVVAIPLGRLHRPDTPIQVARGVDRDCALQDDGTPACRDGTIVHAGTTYDCRLHSETVSCKVAGYRASVALSIANPV